MEGKASVDEWKRYVKGRIETVTQGNEEFVKNFPKTFKRIGDANFSKTMNIRGGIWYEIWTFFNLTEMFIDKWNPDKVYFPSIDYEYKLLERDKGLIEWTNYWNGGSDLKKNLKQSLPTLSMRKCDEEIHIWLQYWLSDIENENGSIIDLAVGFGKLNLDIKDDDEIHEVIISLGNSPIFKWQKDNDFWYDLKILNHPEVIIECKSSALNRGQIEKYSKYDVRKKLLLKYGKGSDKDLGQFDLITETEEDFRNKKVREYLEKELKEFIN